jgi:molybdate transport system regulatory protein
MRLKVKISIAKKANVYFMGPGPFCLLKKIKEHRSINKAAKSMNLSYVKALSMLNRLEKNLGEQMLIRKRGGNERGGTDLTPYAEKFIANYRRLEENVIKSAEDEFQLFLEKLDQVEKTDEDGHA